jgi:hypothetical protein
LLEQRAVYLPHPRCRALPTATACWRRCRTLSSCIKWLPPDVLCLACMAVEGTVYGRGAAVSRRRRCRPAPPRRHCQQRSHRGLRLHVAA